MEQNGGVRGEAGVDEEGGEMRDYREIVWDAEMLQEVTLRSYCLQETIMAHSEVCMCDAVMCKHLRKRVRVCAHSFFFLFFLFSQQGRVGVRLYRWEKG